MPDEQAPVPSQETTPVVPADKTVETPPAPSPKETPSYLTRDELDSFRGEMTSTLTELMTRIEEQNKRFAPREEVQKTFQSASDKTFARVMKQLGPQIKGLDTLVQLGRITKEDAEQAKLALLSNSTTSLANEEEREPEPPAPAPAAPPYDPHKQIQEQAENLLRESGFKWDDVSPEMFKFRNQNRRDMSLGEFTRLIGKKAAERERENLKREAQLEYEKKTKEVREADKSGATQAPPPGGAALPEYKPKATLDDADDIGEVLFTALKAGKLPTSRD